MSWKLSKSIFDRTGIPNWPCRISTICYQQNKRLSTHTTVDTSEVNKFSEPTIEWWKPDGDFWTLHSFNTLRVPFVRDGLIQCLTEQRELDPLKGKHILDVGCGGGIMSEGLARIGAKVTGIDASKEVIDVARTHADSNKKIETNKPTYHNTTIEEHAKCFPNHYDGVVASEIIEHVNNPQLFIQLCVHALKPGGRIFFTTPNRTRLSQFFNIFFAENVLKCVPRGVHQYEKFITPTELAFMLERNNCHVESTYGVQCNPINRKWSFTRFQHLMYVMQAQKLS